jgi:hypothetical protein
MELDDLVSEVAEAAASDDPLDQLAAAARRRDDLAELSDGMLDHFVREARDSGCSWSQIGATLGVSKQAVQQRHGLTDWWSQLGRQVTTGAGRVRRRRGRVGPLARFTKGARQGVVLAQEEARQLNHDYIGTEHVLLGLLREGGGAVETLESFGVSAEAVRGEVERLIGSGDTPPAGHIPFTPRAKKVLELAFREALALGHDYIGTEHVLLGLLREGEGVACHVLVTLGVDLRQLRRRVEQDAD